ncbi:phosphotransferase family protein [Actinotalea sp.]|uniref:phosphotransferase family protein n=1 Tax=Actinotalea sp. TaxID=1872145 RepID=UPI0035617336
MTIDGPPLAFSGSRLSWTDLPRPVRARIAQTAGADVISEASATSGFSPGFASVLELSDGTQVFCKAVSPDQNPESPGLARREIRIAGLLPAAVPAPELLWSYDDGSWVVLGFAVAHGHLPDHPWRPEQLDRVLGAVAALAEVGTPCPSGLPSLSDAVADLSPGWDLLAANGVAMDSAVEALGAEGRWMRENLDALSTWSEQAAAAATGRSLSHGDLRADNILLDERALWIVDWPWATGRGAAWYDLLTILPSIAMQGGGDPASLFRAHPAAREADLDAVHSVLAALAGYFVQAAVLPAPIGIANLRPFQLAQGREALRWLRSW